MENQFSVMPLQMAHTIECLKKCNMITQRFGLSLSERAVHSLAQSRVEALRKTGRVEFGEGILDKLIFAFCDSPYVMQSNYEETIIRLQDIFYYFKGEAEEQIADDELIEYMKTTFDTVAQGSLEYLAGTSLEKLCRRMRGQNE